MSVSYIPEPCPAYWSEFFYECANMLEKCTDLPKETTEPYVRNLRLKADQTVRLEQEAALRKVDEHE